VSHLRNPGKPNTYDVDLAVVGHNAVGFVARTEEGNDGKSTTDIFGWDVEIQPDPPSTFTATYRFREEGQIKVGRVTFQKQ
jgi:hypothetical protein